MIIDGELSCIASRLNNYICVRNYIFTYNYTEAGNLSKRTKECNKAFVTSKLIEIVHTIFFLLVQK